MRRVRLAALAAFALLWVAGCLGPAGHPAAGEPSPSTQPSGAPPAPDLPDRLPILLVSGLFRADGPPYNGSSVACSVAPAGVWIDPAKRDLWFRAGRMNRSTVALVWDAIEVDDPAGPACGYVSLLWRHDAWPARVQFRDVTVEVGNATGGLLLNGTFLAEGDTLKVPLSWTTREGGNDYSYDGNLSFQPLGVWTLSGLHPYDNWSEVPQGNLTSVQDIHRS